MKVKHIKHIVIGIVEADDMVLASVFVENLKKPIFVVSDSEATIKQWAYEKYAGQDVLIKTRGITK